MIAVINYGMGNVGSILNMLKKIGVEAMLINDPAELVDVQKIILPGVGAFDNAMKRLHELGLSESIKKSAEKGIPFLGICLGMQLLGTTSEEGVTKGLNLIPGKIVRFKSNNGIKIPHMGWKEVQTNKNLLFDNLEENKFYFVHSYYFVPDETEHSIGETTYGSAFTSAVNNKNVYGVQFHPEKSHKYGMQLLRNFSKL